MQKPRGGKNRTVEIRLCNHWDLRSLKWCRFREHTPPSRKYCSFPNLNIERQQNSFFFFFNIFEVESTYRACSCLLCDGIQLYTHTRPASFGFFSHTDDHRTSDRVPCASQQVPVGPSFHRAPWARGQGNSVPGGPVGTA